MPWDLVPSIMRRDSDGGTLRATEATTEVIYFPTVAIYSCILDSRGSRDHMSSFDAKTLLLKLQGDSKNVLQFLVDATEADIRHVFPETGNSLLIEAAKHKHRDVCEYLLSKGADASVKNNQGLTAADVCGDEAMRRLLLAVISKDKGVNTSKVSALSPSRQLTSPRARHSYPNTGSISDESSHIESPPIVLKYDPTTPSRHFPISHVNNTDYVLRKSKIRDFLKAKVREAQKENQELEQIHSMGRYSSIDKKEEVPSRPPNVLQFRDGLSSQAKVNITKESLQRVKVVESEQSEGLTDHDGMISSSAPSSPDCKKKDKLEGMVNSSHKTLPLRSTAQQKKDLSSSSSHPAATSLTRPANVPDAETLLDDVLATRRAELKRKLAFFPRINSDAEDVNDRTHHDLHENSSDFKTNMKRCPSLSASIMEISEYVNTSFSSKEDTKSNCLDAPPGNCCKVNGNTKERYSKILLFLSVVIIVLQLSQIFEIHRFKAYFFSEDSVAFDSSSLSKRSNIFDINVKDHDQLQTTLFNILKSKKKSSSLPVTASNDSLFFAFPANGVQPGEQRLLPLKWLKTNIENLKPVNKIRNFFKKHKFVTAISSYLSPLYSSLRGSMKNIGAVIKKAMNAQIPAPLAVGLVIVGQLVNPSIYFYKVHTDKLAQVIRLMC